MKAWRHMFIYGSIKCTHRYLIDEWVSKGSDGSLVPSRWQVTKSNSINLNPTNDKPAMIQIVAWCQQGDRPLYGYVYRSALTDHESTMIQTDVPIKRHAYSIWWLVDYKMQYIWAELRISEPLYDKCWLYKVYWIAYMFIHLNLSSILSDKYGS